VTARRAPLPSVAPGVYSFGATDVRVWEVGGALVGRLERAWSPLEMASFERACNRIAEVRRARAWLALHRIGLVK
jgi:hypothetical protein